MALPAADLNKKADNLTTMELGHVLPLTAEVKDDHLFVGGVDMVELAPRAGYGPVRDGRGRYALSHGNLPRRISRPLRELRCGVCEQGVPQKAAAKIVAEEGLCLDVSGGGELAVARAADFRWIGFSCTATTRRPVELAEAIEAGCRLHRDRLAHRARPRVEDRRGAGARAGYLHAHHAGR